MKRVNFFNTFEISVPIWNWLFPYLKNKNIQPYSILSSGKYRKEKKSSIHEFTKWVWIPFFLKNKKIVNHLFYFFFSPYYLLFNKADLNVFYTQPPFALPFLALLSRLTRVPYIVHIMDYHPDLLESSEMLGSKNFIYKMLDGWYINALKNAKKVIVLGDCMNQMFLAKGIPSEKIDAIPNISSIEEFSPPQIDKINTFKAKHGAQNKLTILYAGNMGVAHEFRTILEVSKHFEDTIQFFFVGKGARRKEVETFVEDKKTNNITLLGYLANDVFEIVLQSADMHFISLRDGFEGIMVPSKLYSSLAIGKPILFEGNKQSEVARVIEKFNCGLYVPHLNQEKMIDQLNRLIQEKENIKGLGANARDSYISHFHSSVFCEKYLQTIQTSS